MSAEMGGRNVRRGGLSGEDVWGNMSIGDVWIPLVSDKLSPVESLT